MKKTTKKLTTTQNNSKTTQSHSKISEPLPSCEPPQSVLLHEVELCSMTDEKKMLFTVDTTMEEVWYDLKSIPRRELENVFRHKLWMIPMDKLSSVISIVERTNGLCVMPFYYYDKYDPLTDCDCCKSGTDYLLQFPKSIIKNRYTFFTLMCEEESEELYRLGFHDTFSSLYNEILDEY
jgi:hypothetical protein